MIVGIPRALLYYKYGVLWETFFDELGIEYIVSPETDMSIIRNGTTYAIDEACFSSKVYLGHVEWLIDRCDVILVPRIFNLGGDGEVCTKFQAIYDLVNNTFRHRNIQLINYNIEQKNSDYEVKAFLKMGKFFGRKKSSTMRAYLIARQIKWAWEMLEQRRNMDFLMAQDKRLKILLVGHGYNVADRFVGLPISDYLWNINVIPIRGDIVHKKQALAKSAEISSTLPWAFNKELVGAVALYKEKVDGIILISSFPCGPDSLVNEIIMRRVKEVPVLNLLIDGQEGRAGLETRLDSFIDVIKFKKGDYSA